MRGLFQLSVNVPRNTKSRISEREYSDCSHCYFLCFVIVDLYEIHNLLFSEEMRCSLSVYVQGIVELQRKVFFLHIASSKKWQFIPNLLIRVEEVNFLSMSKESQDCRENNSNEISHVISYVLYWLPSNKKKAAEFLTCYNQRRLEVDFCGENNSNDISVFLPCCLAPH